MKMNKKELSEKPWKEKKEKKNRLWLKILLCVIAALVLVTGVLIGCAFSKDPERTSHKNEETVILEEFTELGEDSLTPENISEKALKFVALHVEKDPSEVTSDDIKAVFEMLKSGNSLMFDVPENGKDKNTDAVTQKEKFYNILVVGRDKVALNTDVLICASFDTANSKAATVQIPRDSYVEDDKGVKSKINAVFARGYTEAKREVQKLKKNASGKTDAEIAELCKNSTVGITPETLKAYISGKKKLDDICTEIGIKDLQDVITRTFGIYFDYYAIVSTDAFVQIVDAMGGVDVYVQEAMHYDDPLQNLHIHINAGQQHLDGKTAEGFVRFRSGYVQADIARMDAQKIFMTAFFKKLLSFSSLTRIDEIVNAVYKNLDTDMTVDNILAFVRPALNVDMSEITMLNMQGVPYNNGMYYSLNKEENLKIVNEHFNVFSHDLKPNAVHVIELVEGTDVDYTGMTMEDIKDKQPHINFIHGDPTPKPKPSPEPKPDTDPKTDGETSEKGEENEPEGEVTDPETDSEPDTDPDEKSPEDAKTEDTEKDPDKVDGEESEEGKTEEKGETGETEPETSDGEKTDPEEETSEKTEEDPADETEEAGEPSDTTDKDTSEADGETTEKDNEAELPAEGNTPPEAVTETEAETETETETQPEPSPEADTSENI